MKHLDKDDLRMIDDFAGTYPYSVDQVKDLYNKAKTNSIIKFLEQLKENSKSGNYF